VPAIPAAIVAIAQDPTGIIGGKTVASRLIIGDCKIFFTGIALIGSQAGLHQGVTVENFVCIFATLASAVMLGVPI
jgi:hypothetical protein